uniref:CFAP91 domain-containing protein n=1 Tax=Bursaphelenchus xylophilus TaxID=6326 RepID=A0A1I7SKM0_BURXY
LTFHIIQDTRMAATTSSCIQKQQRSKSESRRICFTEEPPQVFAYPDENFAMELGEWKEGRPITYNEYQNIVQTANEETQHQMNQLARWRHQMQLKYSEQERALEVQKF